MKIEPRQITVRDLVDRYSDDDEGRVRGYGGKPDRRAPHQGELVQQDEHCDEGTRPINRRTAPTRSSIRRGCRRLAVALLTLGALGCGAPDCGRQARAVEEAVAVLRLAEADEKAAKAKAEDASADEMLLRYIRLTRVNGEADADRLFEELLAHWRAASEAAETEALRDPEVPPAERHGAAEREAERRSDAAEREAERAERRREVAERIVRDARETLRDCLDRP